MIDGKILTIIRHSMKDHPDDWLISYGLLKNTGNNQDYQVSLTHKDDGTALRLKVYYRSGGEMRTYDFWVSIKGDKEIKVNRVPLFIADWLLYRQIKKMLGYRIEKLLAGHIEPESPPAALTLVNPEYHPGDWKKDGTNDSQPE